MINESFFFLITKTLICHPLESITLNVPSDAPHSGYSNRENIEFSVG